jgi:hypothetical protein
MNVFDLHHTTKVLSAFDYQEIADAGTVDGNIIDTAGFEALEFILQSATLTDGEYSVNLQHGDDSGLSDAASVDAEEVLGSIDFVDTEDNTAKRIGYIGKKRYVIMQVIAASITTGGFLAGTAVLANANHQPVDNQ